MEHFYDGYHEKELKLSADETIDYAIKLIEDSFMPQSLDSREEREYKKELCVLRAKDIPRKVKKQLAINVLESASIFNK